MARSNVTAGLGAGSEGAGTTLPVTGFPSGAMLLLALMAIMLGGLMVIWSSKVTGGRRSAIG